MRFRTMLLAAAGLALQAGAPLIAQATADVATAVKPGATVLDPKGGEVGTIESVNGQTAIVNTGTHKVGLPFASFAVGQKGPVIGMTKAELDAAVGQQQAQTAASVQAGMKVSGAQGAAVGTIATVEGQFATLDTGKAKVRLPLTAFAKGQDGLVIGLTAAQLEAAVQAAAGAPSGSSAPAQAAAAQ